MAIYSEHNDYYDPKLERESYLGGEYYQGEDYLWPLSMELKTGEQRKQRNDKFIHFNFSALVVNTFNAIKFKKEPIIDFKNKLSDDYRNNIDGSGTDAIVQLKEIDLLSHRDGCVYLFIDQPPVPEGISQEEEKNNYRKRIKIIERKSVIDWAIDKNGNYNWIKIYHTEIQDSDPIEDKISDEYVTIITKQSIFKYRKKRLDEKVQDEWILEYENIHPFSQINRVPILKISDNKNDQSLIRDIAKLNQRIDNQTSMIDHLHKIGSVVIPEIHQETELKDNGVELIYKRNPEDTIGVVFKTPENTITPDIRLERDGTIEIIKNLTNNEKDSRSLRSGIAKAYEFLDQESILNEKKLNLEEGYRNALSLLAWFTNMSSKLDYETIVVKISLEDIIGNEIGEAVDFYSQAIKPKAPIQINQELYRAMIKQLLGKYVKAQKMGEIDDLIDKLQEDFFLSFNQNLEFPTI